ncbi:hypothetical protein V6Z11_A12G054000 [Gossypium hirsutum]
MFLHFCLWRSSQFQDITFWILVAASNSQSAFSWISSED